MQTNLTRGLLVAVTVLTVACGGLRPRPPQPPPTSPVQAMGVHVLDSTTAQPITGVDVVCNGIPRGTTPSDGYIVFQTDSYQLVTCQLSREGYDAGEAKHMPTPEDTILRTSLVPVVVAPPEPDRAYQVRLPIRPDGTRGWRDANGPMPVMGASWFPALFFAKHDKVRASETLDMWQQLGVDTLRVFLAVGGWESFWAGREIVPVRLDQRLINNGVRTFQPWPTWDADFRWLLEESRKRRIALFVTAGDLQMFECERCVYERAARVIQQGGYHDVVAFVDVNESWQNTRAGRSDARDVARIVEPLAQIGIPWATSAYDGEAELPAHLYAMSLDIGHNLATLHGAGGTTMMVRRIFNLRIDGVGTRLGLVQGEPRGPGRDVSAGRVNETGWIVLAATASAMTGQMYILHTSRGIRDLAPGEPNGDEPWTAFYPYFTRSRRLLDRLPRSTPQEWGHGGRCGTNPLAVLASTRSDCAFHEDADGVTGQFHRIDVARYANGMRAVMAYGGITSQPRAARVVRRCDGAVYDTHGREVQRVSLSPGQTWTAPGGEDGYVLLCAA